MANDHDFAMPGNGYDVIKKILHAYVLCGDKEIEIPEVAQKAGMNRTMVSRNSGFLSNVGIIEGGRKKRLIPKGRKLAIGVSHDDRESTSAAWRDIVAESSALSGVVAMIKVQGGIPQVQLATKIASHFGLPGGKKTAGYNAVVDILVDAGVIALENDKYCILTDKAPTDNTNKNDDPPPPPTLTPSLDRQESQPNRSTTGSPTIPIHINIELHLPASAEQTVYDAIFKSIRQNLMEPTDALFDAS